MPRFSLLPSQPKFFDLFEKASQNMLEGARLLLDLVTNFDKASEKVAKISEIEHLGDTIVHEVTALANVSLIVPIDHEDTQHLIDAIDNALDAIEDAAMTTEIYGIKKATPVARHLAEVIYRSAIEVNEAIPGLRTGKMSPQIHDYIVKINDLENEGDQLLRKGLLELVKNKDDIFNLIRWKEIYEHLESVTDRLEDTGDVLQRILIKNA